MIELYCIHEKILKIINTFITDHNVTCDNADDTLLSLGVDSITFIKIVTSIEKTFNIEMPDEMLTVSEMATINRISSIVFDVLTNIPEAGMSTNIETIWK